MGESAAIRARAAQLRKCRAKCGKKSDHGQSREGADLVKRVWQHREGLAERFTKTHKVKRLVWFETHGDIRAAIGREKQLKKWNRAWKIAPIQEQNPEWRDLYDDFTA